MKKITSIIARLLIWMLGVCLLFKIYTKADQPIVAETVIDDRYIEYTAPLYAGDVFSQTFQFQDTAVDRVALAFSCEPKSEDSQLLIQFYQNDTLLVEQPLPFSACPEGEFLYLYTGATDLSNSTLTVAVTNISTDSESALRLLATTDSRRYDSYTGGYCINDVAQDGSAFFRYLYFTFLPEYNLYQKLTKMFLVLLTTILLSELIRRLGSRWQQNIPHSRG